MKLEDYHLLAPTRLPAPRSKTRGRGVRCEVHMGWFEEKGSSKDDVSLTSSDV